ncbi:MAG: hypothetical protein M1833_005575 [Piccolia ochrophora]|nr:MAG: hypothetical protein M1833_005575 [Piccolia ochrophora]
MTEEGAKSTAEMQVNPTRAKQLVEAFSSVTSRINAASRGKNVRLVAVSKLKPATDILALYNNPTSHLHFGENYLQELSEKASLLPPSIKWHFIGALQTNKCSPLAQIPNLHLVSSVDSIKKADALNKGRTQLISTSKTDEEKAEVGKLNVHVQINTSSEESKSGVEPSEAAELCRHIRDDCPSLHLAGVMTIGALARSQASTAEVENEDFIKLRDTRDQIAEALGVTKEELELSMGMSEDFESAVTMGSDEVRVGSTIFGERPPRKEAKVVEGSG